MLRCSKRRDQVLKLDDGPYRTPEKMPGVTKYDQKNMDIPMVSGMSHSIPEAIRSLQITELEVSPEADSVSPPRGMPPSMGVPMAFHGRPQVLDGKQNHGSLLYVNDSGDPSILGNLHLWICNGLTCV